MAGRRQVSGAFASAVIAITPKAMTEPDARVNIAPIDRKLQALYGLAVTPPEGKTSGVATNGEGHRDNHGRI